MTIDLSRINPPVTDAMIREIPEFTDADLAKWFAANAFRHTLKFHRGLGWLKWNEIYWESFDVAQVRAEVTNVLKHLEAHIRLSGFSAESIKKVERRLSAASIGAILTQLEGEVYTKEAFFNQSPKLLNVLNGVVHLDTGELMPHDSELGFRHVAPVDYQPGSEHPDWASALSALDPDVSDWLQVAVGQGITGYASPDDKVNFFLGPKASNGKSTIVNGLLETFGEFAVLASEKVLAGTVNDHPTEKMQLFGARLAIVEELPSREIVGKKLKDITGRKITARGIARNNVTWVTTHTVFVTTNHSMQVDIFENAVLRRIRIFPFNKVYVDGDPREAHELRKDAGLLDRIREGAEGQHEAILAWAVEGAVLWFGNGRKMPSAPTTVEVFTEAWRKEADVLAQFFDEYLVADPSGYVASGELLDAMNHYLKGQGLSVWTAATLNASFEGNSGLMKIRSAVRRQRDVSGRSIPVFSGFVPTASKQPWCWHGMRFVV